MATCNCVGCNAKSSEWGDYCSYHKLISLIFDADLSEGSKFERLYNTENPIIRGLADGLRPEEIGDLFELSEAAVIRMIRRRIGEK